MPSPRSLIKTDLGFKNAVIERNRTYDLIGGFAAWRWGNTRTIGDKVYTGIRKRPRLLKCSSDNPTTQPLL
jgi:hypothetical protein